MHVILEKATQKILYIDYRSSQKPLPPEQIYSAFDPMTMEVGWTDKSYIPGYFRIDADGIVQELTIAEAVETGQYKLSEGQKLVDGQIVDKGPKELIDKGLLTLDHFKERLINYFSALSFQKRQELIPDYKLNNAALGVYDDETTARYMATVKAFREEFYRLKSAIEKAQNYQELSAVTPQFPDAILDSKPA